MASLTPFQCLPEHVINRIVNDVVDNANFSLSPLLWDVPNLYLIRLLPLLHVSKRWRLAALAAACRDIHLIFSSDDSISQVTCITTMPNSYPLPNETKYRFARKVTLSIARWPNILEGVTYSELSDLVCSNLILPLARCVSIQLLRVFDTDSICRDYWKMENVLAFASLIKRMAPNINALTLDCGSNAPDTQLTQLHHALLNELLSDVRSAVFTAIYQGIHALFFPRALTNLARISFVGSILNPVHEELIRQNAPGLESLVIMMTNVSASFWMCSNYADSLIEYPYLRLLRVSFPINVASDIRPGVYDMAPFPSLETLEILGYYPFNDDVFFRGNGSRLRLVTIPFYVLAQDIISRYNVFANIGPTRLSRITVSEVTIDDAIAVAACDISYIDRQISQLATSTYHLVYRPCHTRSGILQSFLNQPGLDGLKLLELCSRSLTLGDVVMLVTSLPGLLRLNCRLRKISTSSNSADIANNVERMYNGYYPLSMNLQCWTTELSTGVSVKYLARSVMLLVVLCPNLCVARVKQDIRVAVGREIAWAALMTPFEKHAARLQRFMSDMNYSDMEESDVGVDSGSEPDWDI